MSQNAKIAFNFLLDFNSRLIQDPKIQKSRFKHQDSEIKIQKPRFRLQDSDIKIQKSRSRNQDSEIKIQKSGFRNQDPALTIILWGGSIPCGFQPAIPTSKDLISLKLSHF